MNKRYRKRVLRYTVGKKRDVLLVPEVDLRTMFGIMFVMLGG